MDILFAKGLGLTKKRKESDLQKLLKNMDHKRVREEIQLWWVLYYECLLAFIIWHYHFVPITIMVKKTIKEKETRPISV